MVNHLFQLQYARYNQDGGSSINVPIIVDIPLIFTLTDGFGPFGGPKEKYLCLEDISIIYPGYREQIVSISKRLTVVRQP